MKKIAIVFLTVLMAWPAAAQTPLKFMVSEDVSYDDNIYLTDENTKDSFISSTQVGANYKANVPGSGLELSATGLVGYNAYTEDSSKNNYWNALANVDLKNDMFNIGDNFLYTSDPANSELTERAERINNTGYISFKTSTEKTLGFGLFADDSYDRYFQAKYGDDLNRNRVNVGAKLFYNVSPKTNFFAEYMYSDIAYETNKDNNSTGNTVGLGVEGDITATVNGIAKVTYAMRDYENDVPGVNNYNDLFGYYVALQWQPTDRNTIRLSGERSMQESMYGSNRYYADTLVSLYASQKIFDKWTASLTLGWENMAYDRYVGNTKRNDDLYTIRPALDYQFKDWLSAGVWYQFRTRQSNTNPFDYNRNQAGIYAKALF